MITYTDISDSVIDFVSRIFFLKNYAFITKRNRVVITLLHFVIKVKFFVNAKPICVVKISVNCLPMFINRTLSKAFAQKHVAYRPFNK